MVEYECERCRYTTNQKSNLRKHLQRKNPCEARFVETEVMQLLVALDANKDGYVCEYCNTGFRTSQSKYQHKLRCKQKSLEQQIDRLEDRLAHNHVSNVTNIQNNIQINIRDFGQENVSYLPLNFLSRCFVNKDLVTLIENIHCDREHKENHNVRLKSLKRDLMETRVDGRWIVTDSDETLTDLIKNGYRVLMMHSRKHRKNIVEDELDEDVNEFDRLRDWLDIVYDNKNEQAPIKRKLLLLFMNNKALLLEKDASD